VARAYARWEDPRGEGRHLQPVPSPVIRRVAAFDFECHLAQPGLAAPPIVCASIGNERGAHLATKEEGLRWLSKQLQDPVAHIVGCNIAFDLVVAAVAEPTLLPLIFKALDEDRIHDVAIREALIDIARGDLVEKGEDGLGIRYGMTLLGKRYFNADLKAEKKAPDAWRKRYALLEGIPFEEWPWAARVYPMRDVALPIQIFHKQEGQPNLHDEGNQVRAAFALALMSTWGLRTDLETVKALRARVEAEDLKSTIEFRAHGIIRADGSENQARLRELVTAAYNGEPPKTATGLVATDRDTLVESGNPILEKYGRAGKNDKFLTTYLPILERGIKQPWNPQFNVLVATTRVSSDAQQFPQTGGVRECITARKRWVFCSVDFSGLELRTMAQRAIWTVGFSKMADVLNAGLDPHLLAAASFMGVTYEEALRMKERGTADEKAVIKVYRELGKIWNFGKGGGMGPAAMVFNARKGQKGETTEAPDGTVYVGARFCILAKVADKCGTVKVTAKVQGKQRRICSKCLEVAKKLDAGWLKAWPEQQALFAMASKLTKATRYVQVEIPVANVSRGKCGYTQWLNTPFQGLGAAATKRAMWFVCKEMYLGYSEHWNPEEHGGELSPLYGSRLVLNVHDELLAEMPEERAPEAGDRLAFLMRETLKRYVPDLAKSVEAEPALSRNMSKKATTVRDARGRLQVDELRKAA
jgi:DNA polymerase I